MPACKGDMGDKGNVQDEGEKQVEIWKIKRVSACVDKNCSPPKNNQPVGFNDAEGISLSALWTIHFSLGIL